MRAAIELIFVLESLFDELFFTSTKRVESGVTSRWFLWEIGLILVDDLAFGSLSI